MGGQLARVRRSSQTSVGACRGISKVGLWRRGSRRKGSTDSLESTGSGVSGASDSSATCFEASASSPPPRSGTEDSGDLPADGSTSAGSMPDSPLAESFASLQEVLSTARGDSLQSPRLSGQQSLPRQPPFLSSSPREEPPRTTEPRWQEGLDAATVAAIEASLSEQGRAASPATPVTATPAVAPAMSAAPPMERSASAPASASWAACGLQHESTANDAAIAAALAEALEGSAPSTPPPRRSNPMSLSSTGERPSGGMLRVTAPRRAPHGFADDEAVAIALALAEEDAAAARRGMAPRLRRPAAVDDVPASPKGPGETCIACEDAHVNCCLIPCGHVILCVRCAQKVIPRKCPVCRMQFEQIVRTTRRTRNI
mmetsp:Transcript_30695/g.56638  ORF Transcript_30695/g.56638 Transcript_30695/m.56638 type:complete len:372 (+) Transcript_30695:129-1244(+)